MISKSPMQKGKFHKNIQMTGSAREAFLRVLNCLEFADDECILLPAYIGVTDREGFGVFDPILSSKVNYRFYPIGCDFSVDLEYVENEFKRGDVKAFLLIHYFGFLHTDIMCLKQICEHYDVLLIEDCAHCLQSVFNEQFLGSFGDISFYSIHKILPVEAGGLLQVNNKQLYDKFPNLYSHVGQYTEVADCLLTYDYSKASSYIRHNYVLLAEKLSVVDGVEPVFPDLPDGIVPLNLPAFITKGTREKFYFDMINKGITLTSLYYRLIDLIDKNTFSVSCQISNSIINFPVNQDIEEEDICFMVDKIKEVI